MIRQKRLLEITRRLLRINSENPPGREREIAHYIAALLGKARVRSRVIEFSPGRSNIMAVLAGRDRSSSVLITPHLDTVPAGQGWVHPPFSGRLAGGKIYGRGATDCKGNLACALEAILSMKEDSVTPAMNVIFLATADEEKGSFWGLRPLLEKKIVRADYALVLDSNAFRVIVAQKGLIHFTVSVKGRKAHGAYPDRGSNAIDAACRLTQMLKGMNIPFRAHPLLKPPTVNIGTIRGGDKVNMVADWCDFEADLRFLPGMRAADILSRIKRDFYTSGHRFQISVQDIQAPYEISHKHPLVSGLRAASRGIVHDSPLAGSEGATVITFFQKSGIPAVATGYGSSGCDHITDEFVRLKDLERGSLILQRFLTLFGRT